MVVELIGYTRVVLSAPAALFEAVTKLLLGRLPRTLNVMTPSNLLKQAEIVNVASPQEEDTLRLTVYPPTKIPHKGQVFKYDNSYLRSTVSSLKEYSESTEL